MGRRGETVREASSREACGSNINLGGLFQVSGEMRLKRNDAGSRIRMIKKHDITVS